MLRAPSAETITMRLMHRLLTCSRLLLVLLAFSELQPEGPAGFACISPVRRVRRH